MKTEKSLTGIMFLIAPALLISVSIILVPGIMTIVYSFTDWNGSPRKSISSDFENFKELFHDKIFS